MGIRRGRRILARALLAWWSGTYGKCLDGVERGPGGDEEGVEIPAAETDVGGLFGHGDEAELVAVLIKDVNATLGGGVDVAAGVDAHAVTADRDFEGGWLHDGLAFD